MSVVGCREILTHSLFLISHIKAAFEDTAGERRKERVKLVTLPRDGGLLGGSEAPGLTLGRASISPSCSHALTHGGCPLTEECVRGVPNKTSPLRAALVRVRGSARWCMPAGKGGIQGLCERVCIQYTCVIMGMWCGVCIVRVRIRVCVCVSCARARLCVAFIC